MSKANCTGMHMPDSARCNALRLLHPTWAALPFDSVSNIIECRAPDTVISASQKNSKNKKARANADLGLPSEIGVPGRIPACPIRRTSKSLIQADLQIIGLYQVSGITRTWPMRMRLSLRMRFSRRKVARLT